MKNNMNYEEAKEHSRSIPWKTQECFSGPDCWCRMVVPIEPIKCFYSLSDGSIQEDTLDQIIGPASIDQETAEYIVELHNSKLGANI